MIDTPPKRTEAKSICLSVSSRWTIAIAWLLLAASLSDGAGIEPPNIVYILTDDLGYGCVASFNPEGKIPTPCIDRLADQGMMFTDAHSGSALCTPTRYGILTGRYCWRTRLRSGVLPPYSPPLIPRDMLTVPKLLKEHGYHTACIGKWHLGWDWPTVGEKYDFSKPISNGPVMRGFDEYFGIDAPNYPPYCFIHNDRTVGVPSVMYQTKLGEIGMIAGWSLEHWNMEEILPTLCRCAVQYIECRACDKQPFFLYLSLTSPHEPIVPTAEWRGRSGIHPVADFIMQTDAVVGEVLEALDRCGMTDNTLVIFTSDNGASAIFGQPDLANHGHSVSGPLRGYKSDIWDGGHRVPFVARWPGKIEADSRCDDVICLTDLMATVSEILGAQLPDHAGVDSVSILPDLLGTAQGPVREAVVHQSGDGSLAIRQGNWKLVFCPGSGGASPPANSEAVKLPMPRVQLFDLCTDIGERHNVCAEHPDVVQRLTSLMMEYISTGRSTPGRLQDNDAPAEFWQLR